jgi:hypothetical protein
MVAKIPSSSTLRPSSSSSNLERGTENQNTTENQNNRNQNATIPNSLSKLPSRDIAKRVAGGLVPRLSVSTGDKIGNGHATGVQVDTSFLGVHTRTNLFPGIKKTSVPDDSQFSRIRNKTFGAQTYVGISNPTVQPEQPKSEAGIHGNHVPVAKASLGIVKSKEEKIYKNAPETNPPPI